MTDPDTPVLGPKAAQAEATRGALVATARELFAQHGYAGVATEEIVRAAGVTRGALYHHFGGKEDLFRSVLRAVNADIAQQIAAEVIAVEDPWEGLRVGAAQFLEVSASSLEVQRIVLIDGPSVLGWEEWREIDAEFGLGLVEFALQRAVDAGQLARQPLRPLAHVLLGALDEAALMVARADDVEATKGEVTATIGRLLDGLRAR
jgi:AcrR family transcriptional regulator